METIEGKKRRILKPRNMVIQICPVCDKLDVALNDNHDCGEYIVAHRMDNF